MECEPFEPDPDDTGVGIGKSHYFFIFPLFNRVSELFPETCNAFKTVNVYQINVSYQRFVS